MNFYNTYYQLTGNFNFPLSVYDPLIILEDLGFDDSKLIYVETKVLEVETANIVGSRHCDYEHSKNWIHFLSNLKRIHSIEDLKYYSTFFTTDACEKITWGYGLTEYKSKYWISGGNHRICIAKILGIEKIKVPVSFFM